MHKEKRANEFSTIEDIILLYYEKIYKYCYWRLRNPHMAQDVTQETFLRFIKYYDEDSEIKNINAYIYRIAGNECANAIKKEGGSYEKIVEIEDITAEGMMESVIDKVIVENALNSLNEEEQEMIRLRYSQNLTIKEIAEVMGTNHFHVQYCIKAALKKLKRKM